MVQLVITIIGIALMAAAAVMAVHYGVESYDSKHNDARAVLILAHFQKIKTAYQAYDKDHKAAPAVSIDLLLSNGYLILKPIPPAMGAFKPRVDSYVITFRDQAPYMFVDTGTITNDTGVRATVCQNFNKLLGVAAEKLAAATGFASLPDYQVARQPLPSGCYIDSQDNSVKFYYSLL